MNYGKITEKYKIDAEIISITSAAGATSLQYDMKAFEQALVAVNVEGSYIGGVTIDLMESSAATAAGSSAAGSKAGIVIGGTANTNVDYANGVRALTLTHGGEATGATGDSITLSLGTMSRTFIYTTSTANLNNSTAWSTVSLYFGTTVESSANTGAQLGMDALKAAINSTLAFGNALICTTPATNTLRLDVRDEAAGPIGFGSTGSTALLVAMVNQAVGCFDIKADQLTSTANKRFISAKVSTASTACRAAVTVIRGGGRYLPASGAKYKLSS